MLGEPECLYHTIKSLTLSSEFFSLKFGAVCLSCSEYALSTYRHPARLAQYIDVMISNYIKQLKPF